MHLHCRPEEDTNETRTPPETSQQESLADSLTFENESGCFFKQFVSKQSNKVCLARFFCYLIFGTIRNFEGHLFNLCVL